jgi:hypothetical protein
MNVKDAATIAITHIIELFKDEKLSNVGLEEATYNENKKKWEVTVGFSRPWDYHEQGLVTGLQPLTPNRQYKIVHIDSKTREVKSVTIREVNNA